MPDAEVQRNALVEPTSEKAYHTGSADLVKCARRGTRGIHEKKELSCPERLAHWLALQGAESCLSVRRGERKDADMNIGENGEGRETQGIPAMTRQITGATLGIRTRNPRFTKAVLYR